MADKSIGDLERASQINDNDLFVLEQNGTAKSLIGKKVKDYVYRDIDNASATTLPSSSQATANYNSNTHTMEFGIPAGKSAYDTAVEGGYTETETQFNHDLSGIGEVVKYDNGEIGQTLPLNADRLNGHPDSYFAKQDDLTTAEQSITRNTAARHTHPNKSIIDQITQAMLDLIGTIAGKYVKPAGGIPKTDLASDVRTSLGKADSALQQHQSLASYRTATEQDTLDAQKYSPTNPPPYPVSSVNGQVGGVVLNYITFDEEEEQQ